jgi:hypothetical protein
MKTNQGFLKIPMQLVRDCVNHKPTLFVYAWLQAYEKTNADPSVATVADQCGMKERACRARIHWLEANDWIRRIERPGKTCLYRVITDRA